MNGNQNTDIEFSDSSLGMNGVGASWAEDGEYGCLGDKGEVKDRECPVGKDSER